MDSNLPYDKIVTYFKENKGLVAVLAVTDFLFNALMCLIPVVQGMAVNAFSEGRPFRELLTVTLSFVGLVLFVQVNRYAKRYLGRSFGSRIALSMRRVSYENLIRTELSYFQNVSKGDILNKILSDIADASDGITKMTTECFDTLVLLSGYLITMIIMDVQIALIVMVFVLLSIISSKAFKKLIYGYTKEYKEYLSYTKDFTLTCLTNELNYRSLGVNGIFRKRYGKSQDILEKKALKSMVLQSCLEPVYSIVTWLGLFFIVFLGGRRVLQGTLSIGVFTAFLSTYLLVAQKASRIGRVYGWYQNLKVSWVRCKPYLVRKEDMHQKRKELVGDFCLEAEDFSFSFVDLGKNGHSKAEHTEENVSSAQKENKEEAFHLPRMNFKVHKGEMIGICGKVHTGKSTLLAALSGLYPYEGSLRLNGRELRENRVILGYCSSENLVFEDTLSYNVTMGRPGEGLKSALEDAHFWEEVEAFPNKEEQILSHSLVNLSGGQQKRLMLARALYGRPPLILLDDPFQSIDKKQVEQILKRLRSYEDSIIFAVTNQEFLLEKMDWVLELRDGGYAFRSTNTKAEDSGREVRK